MTIRVALLDYGSGNLRSAQRALIRVGAEVDVTSDPATALNADGLVVPGVGAFAACMEGLRSVQGPRLIGERLAGSRPVLGICVGMQVMFERGVEFADGMHQSTDFGAGATAVGATRFTGTPDSLTPDPLTVEAEVDLTVEPVVATTAGCGEWTGIVERLSAPVLPHMGWNTVEAAADSVLFSGIDPEERFYFVHSYAAQRWAMPSSSLIPPAKLTWARHGSRFLAAVENGPLSATQFHPEKSGDTGAQLLQNWVRSLT